MIAEPLSCSSFRFPQLPHPAKLHSGQVLFQMVGWLQFSMLFNPRCHPSAILVDRGSRMREGADLNVLSMTRWSEGTNANVGRSPKQEGAASSNELSL